MGIWKGIKDWFFPPYMKRAKSLKELTALIPVGNLTALCEYTNEFVPYRYDTDTGEKDGKYDPLKNYNGADLTLKAGHGDCESKAAVHCEVIRTWGGGWSETHLWFAFTDSYGVKRAHDICFFTTPEGREGWIEGQAQFGDRNQLVEFYKGWGWSITKLYAVNDMGEKI